MSKLTVEARRKQQGANYKGSFGALWEVLADADEPQIPVKQIITAQGSFGAYSFFDHATGRIMMLGAIDPAVATYKIVEVVATRDTPKEYGGYTKGNISHRLVAA